MKMTQARMSIVVTVITLVAMAYLGVITTVYPSTRVLSVWFRLVLGSPALFLVLCACWIVASTPIEIEE